MTKCWYCTFPNSIPVLWNHPYYLILDMPDKILCVFRGHGDISGCKPCIIRSMKKAFELKAQELNYTKPMIESWDEGHYHLIIEK